MKTALLHYWLTNMRGGENVFREICVMFRKWPQAYLPLMLTACLKMGRKLKIVGTGGIIRTWLKRLIIKVITGISGALFCCRKSSRVFTLRKDHEPCMVSRTIDNADSICNKQAKRRR